MTTSEDSEALPEEFQERRFRVHGHVQGVGFRWWTRSQAQRLRISGEVRNREDGTVEIRARGRNHDLEKFARLLNEGAPGAAVSAVDQELDQGVPAAGFEITR